MANQITYRRVYEETSPKDGTRVLVDRAWPRACAGGRAAPRVAVLAKILWSGVSQYCPVWIDGTLVTRDKVLTDRAIEAVRALHAADILFAITSGRPPRGMSMLIQPLQLATPIAAFNGGLFVNPDMSVIEQHVIPPRVVAPAVALLESFGLDVWLYRGADWFVRDLSGPHVDREAWTVRFPPPW